MRPNTAPLSFPFSTATVVSCAKTTAYPYRCHWKGCDALLNCWKNLQKHYYLHCLKVKRIHGIFACDICSLDNHHAHSLQDLTAHVDKVHLSRVHLPCPFAECDGFKSAENLDPHFRETHSHVCGTSSVRQPSTLVAPQAFPFQPELQLPPPLPQGRVSMHTIISSIPAVQPAFKGLSQHPVSRAHLTPWSTFAFAEHYNQEEEKDMIKQDLGFKLVYPSNCNECESSPWPAFSIPAQPAAILRASQVSQPFYFSSQNLDSPEYPQTILYHAFEQWYNDHGELSQQS